MIRALLPALLLSVAAAGQKPATAPIDKARIEAYLRHLELWLPAVKVAIADPTPSPVPGLSRLDVHLSYGPASQTSTYYLSADGRHILRASVYDLSGNPFAADLNLLDTSGQPAFGPAGAPLTLAVFSDFQCPLCKDEAIAVRRNIPAAFPNDVRVVFFDLPLDAIHPWARAAAMAGRCAFAQSTSAFWSYFDYLYAHQSEIGKENLREKVLEWSKSQPSVDAEKLVACMDGKATESEVNRSVELARKLGVNSTPTVFLNGRKLVGNTPWANLEQVIRIDLEHAKRQGGK